jgi:hypothetical protein
MKAGNYIIRLLTDNQLAGTEQLFAVSDSRGGITIVPLPEADIRYFPVEAGKDGPVLYIKPDPSSIMISYCLYLPEAANLSIELYDEKGNKNRNALM